MLYLYNLANTILIHNHSDFFSAMCKWDCKWYMTIIKDGYDLHPRLVPKVWKGLANWAFFPLYPYAVKFTAIFTGLSALVAGILLNQFLIFLSLILFYKYLRLFTEDHNSRFGVILLAFSPFSVYFASLYTEAMFLFLSLSAFYFLRSNKPYISAISGGLLSATRPVGIMFGVAFFCHYLRMHRKFNLAFLICCVIISSGLLCYMWYLYALTGDFLAFQHIQKAWGRHGFELKHISSQLWQMLSDVHNSILFLLSCVISIYLIMQKYYEEALFNLFCILPGALTGTMMSEGRFAGTLFTLYFGLTLISRKSSSLKITLAFTFIVFYVSYFLYWLAKAKFLV